MGWNFSLPLIKEPLTTSRISRHETLICVYTQSSSCMVVFGSKRVSFGGIIERQVVYWLQFLVPFEKTHTLCVVM